ncbi:hypothetical protein B2G71_05120 [Novosphingobium sp. PC22D]|nr:hypothetical protein B2G71_05120 [Novosphingobium sp. PC22D]
MVGGLALLLCVLLLIIAWSVVRREDNRPTEAEAHGADVPALPARPEDIEAHGEAAKTTLAPPDARQRNEAVPFAPRIDAAARPFVFKGSDQDRARALACLATAVLYEAGDDTTGEAAVAQVVLNRVRHPAFPSTICGVVYQGSERRTGCQFTFTCDGSLGRKMSDAAWRRAREVADSALSGSVDDSVGLATHYHTDWVYPYWSPELRKLARVGTHLFFGWPGTWGGPKAFSRVYRGNEQAARVLLGAMPGGDADDPAPVDMGAPKILGLPQPPAKLPARMGEVPLYGNKLKLVGRDGHSFGLLAPSGIAAAKVVNAALALCDEPGPCRVNAWANEDDIPGEYPISQGSRSMMVFEYARDGAGARPTLKFDCQRFPNKDPNACLDVTSQVPDVLAGIRFKKN